MAHGTYRLLGIAPNAAKMKRFVQGLEGRIARQLGRAMEVIDDFPDEIDENDERMAANPLVSERSALRRAIEPAPPVLEPAEEPSPVAEAGWYTDPYGRAELRWFDGEQWTEHEHDGAGPTSNGHRPSAPQLPKNFCADILREAGFPATLHNLAAVHERVASMFLTQGQTYITRAGTPADLHRFNEAYGRPGADVTAWPQDVLDGIVAWNPETASRLTSLPERVRAALLRSVDDQEGFFAGPASQPLPTLRP
jgi:hypothetical protein